MRIRLRAVGMDMGSGGFIPVIQGWTIRQRECSPSSEVAASMSPMAARPLAGQGNRQGAADGFMSSKRVAISRPASKPRMLRRGARIGSCCHHHRAETRGDDQVGRRPGDDRWGGSSVT